MNINELGEDLEQQFGKPRNITEENVRFMLSLIKEEYDGTKVNENVEKPSLEAFGMTILAVMSYQTTPWEELANVFIDEFDAFYHHELSYKICKRLFEGNNQVFVTTHDTFLLSNDLLRPDCFFILRNNEIKAICDLTDKELRFAHNLEKLYRGGTFGL